MHLRRTASLLIALVAFLAFPLGTALAATKVPPGMPPKGKVLLGMGGHQTTMAGFDSLTRAEHDIHLITIPWRENRGWHEALDQHLETASNQGYRLMVHIGPQRVEDGKLGRSPGAVASGVVDRYFLDMGRVLNESEQFVYVRPPAEMNAHWSLWSAFNSNGSSRGAAFSTRSYRKAFIRITLIARGGSVAKINTALRRNGMPNLKTSATELPSSGRIATVFNPQARGKPDKTGNQPWDYYPGAAWVDYMANDLYAQSGSVAWAANDALYKRYAKAHPFMMAEYAPWGYDDPGYITKMFDWATSHPRTVALMYFNGTSGTTFRLSQKPRSLAAYRTLANRSRHICPAFSAFVETCTAPAAD